jgi:hypothetical protein
MSVTSESKYKIRLPEPRLAEATPPAVVDAVERAHERHLRDWIVEARRRAYQKVVLAEFGQLVNRVDTQLRTNSNTSLWRDERYRIETTSESPASPAVVYRSDCSVHLTETDLQSLPPAVREDLFDAFESKVHAAINRTLALYSRAAAAFATRQLATFLDTYERLTDESRERRTAVRSFEVGESTMVLRVPTEMEPLSMTDE